MLEQLAGKKVVLLGRTGQVGRRLAPLIEAAVGGHGSYRDPDHEVIDLPEGINKLPIDANVVICLSAVSKPEDADADPAEALRVNVDAVHRIADHYRGTNCRVIFASSVRSASNDSVYAYTKIATEAIASGVGHSPSVTIMRLGNLIETARVIERLSTSVQTGEGGFVANTVEYFQPMETVPVVLDRALTYASGTIVTPLLPIVSIPFIAGVFVGFAQARGYSITRWNPEHRQVGVLPPLLPSWWLPFTTVDSFDLSDMTATGSTKSISLLATNLRKSKNNEQQSKEVEEALRGNALFGKFVEHLELESRFPAREHRSEEAAS